jgi:small subunit ribosomal protein S17
MHPKYKKKYKVTKKFYAHDEKNISKEWEVVTIKEVKPISKIKRWILIEKKIN